MRAVEVTLAGGLMVDLATRGDIEDHHRWLQDFLARTVKSEPTFIPLEGQYQAAAAATTWGFMNLGGPQSADHIWIINRYSVTAADPTSVVAGAQVVSLISTGRRYVDGSSFPNPPPYIIEPGAIIPNSANYGARTVMLLPKQELWLAFKSLPNSQQLFANGLAIQFPRREFFLE